MPRVVVGAVLTVVAVVLRVASLVVVIAVRWTRFLVACGWVPCA